MGCSGSKNNKPSVGGNRRRLSVGELETDGVQVDITEEQRGMIIGDNQESILDLVNVDGRKMSIGSNTDSGKTSFANKTLKGLGAYVDAPLCGLGYTCRKGLKPESPNQDSFFILKTESCSIYGVFDGHGQKGHDVSNFVKENMPRLIVKDGRFMSDDANDRKALLKDVFQQIQNMIVEADRLQKPSAKLSGTTATVAIHNHEKKIITIAHVADSTCVVGKYKPGSKDAKDMLGEAVTKDHKPDVKEERARIEKKGGRVVFDGYANHRIYAKNGRYPGLNMSRCLGDLLGHKECGIIAEPDVTELAVEDHLRWLLLCSDGVWEFITPSEAVSMIKECQPDKAMGGAERLAKAAWDRWIKEEGGAVVDDITCVMVALNMQN